MATTRFKASTQYGDFEGSASADRHDVLSFSRYLENEGLINEGEFLAGIQFSMGEVSTDTLQHPFGVWAYVTTDTAGFENAAAFIQGNNPVPVRQIRLQLPAEKFFGLFKRFSVSISPSALLSDREISYAEQG